MNRIEVMKLVREFQVGQISRRDFLKRATIAVGSLAAANTILTACDQFPNPAAPPVIEETTEEAAEETTTTDTETMLITETVEYPDTDEQTLMGYLAYHNDGEPKPAVIVIQEWWGLNDHIKDLARRFADEGYIALAPDLYHGEVATEPDEARKLVMELDTPEAVKEIQQAIAYLQTQDFVAGDTVGIVGFCMGGGLVFQTALVADTVGAGVAFYGRPFEPAQAGEVKAPLMTHIGTNDNIPVADLEAVHAALDEAGIENQLFIYEDAQHAFFNDTRADVYDADAADAAWSRTLEWFETHLA